MALDALSLVRAPHLGVGAECADRKRALRGVRLRRVRPAAAMSAAVRACCVCGCTDDDCSGCVGRTGEPCHWVGANLCSACADIPAVPNAPRPVGRLRHGSAPVRMSTATAPATKPRFRLRAPIVPEVDLQAAIGDALDILLLPPAVWTAIPIGHVKLTGQQAARLARIGVKRGWFDALVIHDGHPYGLEIKRQGGRLSTDRLVPTRAGGRRMVEGQVSVFPKLTAAGCRIATVSSVEDALRALAAWNVPLRGVS